LVHIEVVMIKYHWYDWKHGYLDTNPGWYEHIVPCTSARKHEEMVKWLYKNISNPERHCRWTRLENETRVKFRHEKDYVWFSLSF